MSEMFERIWQHQWMTLSKDVRDHLTKIFDIPTSSICEIRDEFVVSDGKTNDDLLAITREKLAKYINDKTGTMNYGEMFDIAAKKAKFQLNPTIVATTVSTEGKPTYCDMCVSTAGRHKKYCPKYK